MPRGAVECGVSPPTTTLKIPRVIERSQCIAAYRPPPLSTRRGAGWPTGARQRCASTTVDAVRAGPCCPASHPDAARRARTVACGAAHGQQQDKCCPTPSNRTRTRYPRPATRCGQPRPTPSPRRRPKGSAARGLGLALAAADRSKPPTRRSSTASSLMVEATRARRRRPRRKIDGAMMCLWPRLNYELWRR